MNTSLVRTTLMIPASLAVIIVAMALGATPRVCFGAIGEGDVFPDLKTFRLEGELPDLAGKVVLVDFFASWCGPCKESFPVMQEMQEKFGDKGFVVLAVNLDKKTQDMIDFLAEHPVTFPVVRDGTNALVRKLRIATMPSSFILDGSGKVHFLHRGFKGDKTKNEYLAQISGLLD